MWIERIGHDLRFALRQMRRSRSFTAVTLAAVAMGIAANSAVFSFIDAVYLRTSPAASSLIAWQAAPSSVHSCTASDRLIR